MSIELLKNINELVGKVHYLPYSIGDTVVLLGTPQVPIEGLQYVWASFDAPQRVMVKSLNAKCIWVPNNNKTGTIEFALLPGTVSNGVVELLTLTGIPFPINILDNSTLGTSRVLGASCQLTTTPEWRREALPGLNVYTFSTNRLDIAHGVRAKES